MFKKTTLIFLTLVVIVSQSLVHLPDWIKWKNTPDGFWFTGQASWFDPWDLNVYFSAIGWGRRAGLIFQNLYDTQSDKPMQIYAIYTLLGKIFSSFTFSNAAIFHISVIILNFLLAGVVWWFLRIFLIKTYDAKIAFVLVFFGGGLGWLFFPQLILPDLGQPGFIFESATRRPHEAVSYGLFLLTIGALWKGAIEKRRNYLFIAGISSFIAFYFHPYSALSLGVIVSSFGLYSIYKEKRWVEFFKTPHKTSLGQSLITLGVSGAFYLAIFGRQILSDPSSSGLVEQIQYSPNPFYAILGWGILFPFIVVTLLTPAQKLEINFLKLWFLSHFLIIYIPLGFQKLLIRGLWVVAVMLAVIGIGILAKKAKLRYGALLTAVVIFACISSVFIFTKKVSEPATNRWMYLSTGEKEIIDYLNSHGQNEEGVMASYRIGNIIPASTEKRVWVGHEFQTPDFKNRIAEVNAFYAGKMTSDDAKEFLKKSKAVWVFWGPDEKAIGGLSEIANQDLLEKVLINEKASLLKVKNP